MDNNKRDELSKYGKLVCDFANAKTTDDILTSFFDNLQSAFKFSKNFTQKAIKQIPTKKIMTERLTSKEIELFEKLLQRNKILKSCNTNTNVLCLSIDKYDPINSMFLFTQKTYYTGIPDPNQDYFPEEVKILENKMEDYIEERVAYHRDYSEIEDGFRDNLIKELKTLANLCHYIEKNKSDSTDHFTKIEKMAEVYLETYNIHDYVKENQEYLKSILLQIIKSDDSYESKAFKIILEQYNNIKQKICVDKKEQKLIASKPFIEKNFFNTDSRFVLEEIFNLPISYCLIEVLKDKENLTKIKVCNKCSDYFIEKRKGRKQYCSDKCRLDYHNKKNVESGKHAEYMKGKRQEGNPKYH